MSKLVQNYLLQEPIGKGVYGQVFRAIHQKSKEEYAVKVIPKNSFKSNPKLEQLAINQINILSSLKNQNIVRFIETLKTPNNFYFVYEYCNGGTLESLLHKKKSLTESQALVIFRQLLEAFKELNKNNIMHRDLKPDNIFFNDGKVKLGDFGFCKMLEVNMAQTMLGSPIYMAPQILKQEIYTLKADIWSLGVVLFEMLFGYCPFESSSISQLINVIKDTQLRIPKEINPISSECQTLINKMLVKDQFKRIQWVDLFDFKIDESGKVLSGYKKDMGIEALEKYFLFDVKNEDLMMEKKISGYDTEKPNYDKIIYSTSTKQIDLRGTDLLLKKNPSIDKAPQLTTNISGDKQKGQKDQIPKTPQPQSYQSSYYSAQTAPNFKDDSFSEQQSRWTKNVQPFDAKPFEKEKPDITPSQPISAPTQVPQLPKEESFIDRHSRWLRGVQLLDELSDCGDSAEVIFCYVVASMLKQINDQYPNHPQWTDVLMDEKRCLSDTLRALGRDENHIDLEGGKNELLKLWKGGQERWKLMWTRAIKFIYNSEGSHTEVEQILS